MLRLLLGLCLALALALPAWAQDTGGFSDEDFVAKYFGSTLILFSPTPLPVGEGEYGSWTDKLPDSLKYNTPYIAGLINANRIQKGITPLIDPDDSVVIPEYEPLEVDGGWRYQIDFMGLRPSEVELVLQSLGGIAKVAPGTQASYLPLLTASIYASLSNWTDPFVVRLGAYEFTFEQGQSPTSLLKEVQAKLGEKFDGITVNVSVDYSVSAEGDASSNLGIEAALAAG